MMKQNKEKNFISAVLYTYNEEKRIFDFLDKVNQILDQNFEHFEIICVNDASTDKTIDEIKRYADTIEKGVISILNMSFHQGLELSMNAGIDLSIGDFVYEFDSLDRDYPVGLIKEIYDHSLKGYDIVSAVPNNGQRIYSRLFYAVFNKVSKSQSLLQTETFRILSRRGINRVHSMSKTIPYRKAVYANCGLKTDTIRYERDKKVSKLDRETKRIYKETAVDALILYTDAAYRVSISFALLMIVATLGIGIYSVAVYFAGKPVEGWTTTMLFLSISFVGLFVISTILIKYLSIILRMNFNKMKYVIESVQKING